MTTKSSDADPGFRSLDRCDDPRQLRLFSVGWDFLWGQDVALTLRRAHTRLVFAGVRHRFL